MAAVLPDIRAVRNILSAALNGRATPAELERHLLPHFAKHPTDAGSAAVGGLKFSTRQWICECLGVLAEQGVLTSEGNELVLVDDCDGTRFAAALGVGATGYFDGSDSKTSLEELIEALVCAFGEAAVRSALDAAAPTEGC
jgi:hypothetical protein